METSSPVQAGTEVAAASAASESHFNVQSMQTVTDPMRPELPRPRVMPPPRSILIYSPQFNTIGGVETHLVRLSCFLAKRNCRVTLVTTSGMLEEARVQKLTSEGVEFIAPPGGTLSVPRKMAWLAWLVATQLRRRHWDVIYTNAQGSLSWLLYPLKRQGVRLVHHYHTAGDERDQSTWGSLFPRWLKAVDEIVACSKSTAHNLRRVLPANHLIGRGGWDKLRVIPYLSAGIAPSPRRVPREPGTKLRFGFVGRLVEGKGIDTICELSRDPQLADIEWHIHGCGTDYDAAHFEQYPNVRYHGRYNGSAELASILARLDALVLFSRYQEGQPISLIEGMSAGLPWVATDQGGTSELMWSPSNCRLVSAECRLSKARGAVLDLAQAIRDGRTSMTAQRGAYDDHLAPEIVGERWLEFLATEAPPHLDLLDQPMPVMKFQ